MDQIINCINNNHEVDIYPGTKINEKSFHKNVVEYDLLRCTHYPAPIPSNIFVGSIKVMWLLIKNYKYISVFENLFSHPSYTKVDFYSQLRLISILVPYLGNGKNYDLIHCHFGPSGLRALFLKSLGLLDGKMITTFHGYDVNLNNVNKSVYQELFENGDKFIVVSKYIAKKAMDLGCQKDKITVIPNGINSKFFKPQKEKYQNKKVRLVSICRLVEKKGLIYALKAFKILHYKYPNLVYDIVGDGSIQSVLQNFIRNENLESFVTIHGSKNKNDILKFYQNSDIFLLPYVTAEDGDSEGQGIVLQEAQAVELPVVSTFHNGVQEGVLNNITSFLVSERNIDSLVEKLELLITNRNLRIRMGKRGREYVSRKFNYKIFNEKLNDEYLKLVE